MGSESMMNAHRTSAPWQWPLEPSTATRLAPAAGARWLLVSAGRVWLTESGAGPDGDDVWLGAGETWPIPAGSEWVIEGWPQARVELLQAPSAAVAGQRRFGVSAWSRS